MSDASKRAADWDALYAGVHIPAFFARLAEHGLSPANEKQAGDYLDIGVHLYSQHQNQLAKQASAGDDFLAKIANDLRATSPGIRGDRDVEAESWTKEAYAQLVQNPDIVDAARSFVSGL